jgi:hypothetical protein
LYSIEVDYYHFGTCQIVGGSYFCGDHSCSTYRYIGSQNVVENFEKPELCDNTCLSALAAVLGSQNVFASDGACDDGGAGSEFSTCVIGTDCGDCGPRPSRAQQYEQQAPPTALSTAAQYQRLTGRWLNVSVINNATLMQYVAGATYPYRFNTLSNGINGHWDQVSYPGCLSPPSWTSCGHLIWLSGVFVTPLHLQRNLYPGLCEKRCNEDATCKAYQESRWQYSSVVAECYLFHMPRFRSSYSDHPLLFPDTWWWEKEGDAASDQSHLADFYLAVTKPKEESWLHVPKVTSNDFPLGANSRAPFTPFGTPSTARDPIPPGGVHPPQPAGRRLKGVY